nr:alcohol dehydrogenase catalytic domain-containing protein [Thermodesulfobacterium commune]
MEKGKKMKAWVIDKVGLLSPDSLKLVELPVPEVEEDEILVKVYFCGICHTELDEIEGRATPDILPVVPGHQIVGEVVEVGPKVEKFKIGDKVGAGWIYSSCQRCEYCERGLENLCQEFKATGKDVNGGYAEYFKIKETFAFAIPEGLTLMEAAPLFCAGAIGYRALKLTQLKGEEGETLGLSGFGASNHLVLKLVKALFPKVKTYVFARNPKQREHALSLGADWAGDFEDTPPEGLKAIIDTTPVWRPLLLLKHLKPNGRFIINAIRKEEQDKEKLLFLDYGRDLWLEKEIKSVANITCQDLEEFLSLAKRLKLKPDVIGYPFYEAPKALFELKEGKIKGAKVLVIEDPFVI